MMKTLSVIMPNFNYGQWIEEALKAIVEQSYSPMEIIVVDDGSTDDSVLVIEKLMKDHSNIRLLKNEKNKGVVYSMGRGLEAASGDYVFFTASDDKVLPELFSKSMTMLEKYPEAGLCCSDTCVSQGGSTSDTRLWLSDKRTYFPPLRVVNLLRGEAFTPILPHTVIIKRAALIEAGGYLLELKWSCDTFAFHVVSFRYGICYIPEVLTMVRFHLNNWGGGRSSQGSLEREVIEKMIIVVKRSQYADVLPMFKRTAPFSSRPWQVLFVVIRNREYWEFLSLKLVRFGLYDLLIRSRLLNILSPRLTSICRKIVSGVRKGKYILRIKK